MPRGAILDVALETIDGQPASLRDYEGEALLIVNVASKCGLTPHYAGLQKLYETYRDRGLEILGFPCNQFGNQEPGTPAEIVEFCKAEGLMMQKIPEQLELIDVMPRNQSGKITKNVLREKYGHHFQG